ncbi:RICIN domain-containing protein [Streptomyces sp. MS2.AVA.5]|uniref:RICIN domain-containing protein n=1 Tax=Streptomyces achmelvichensis TaxID=3134111 RepID=A0ACC6PNH9_9ACTN
MPELHQVGPDPADHMPAYAALSDAELTERIRAGAPPAFPATQELKRRHLPAVLAYARLCGRDQVAGNQLAVQAFDLAAQEAIRGIEPRGNWRHHLLMLVQRVGRTWAEGNRRDRLEPDFAAWADESADRAEWSLPESQRLPFEMSSAMLAGFYGLPELTRGILWYTVVDREPDDTAATYLGVRPDIVSEQRTKAQDAMRQAYIKAYLARADDKRCAGFQRIIEASVRPGDRRRSDDLTNHLAECTGCTRLMANLARMTANPRGVFAEGLLQWGGAAYAARRPVRALLDAVPAQPERSPAASHGSAPAASEPRKGARLPTRPVVLAAVAVAAAVIAGTVLATTSGDASGPVASDRPTQPPQPAWPPASASAPAPSPSPSPTREASKPPTPRPSPTASAPKPPAPPPSKAVPPPPAPAPIVPGGGYTRVVNAGSGLCLDIEDGVMENRTDVITARCNGAETQQWSLEPGGLLRSNADPDFCLDSRGDTDRGVGIWSCSSADGKNGMNLRFTVDASGAVRPYIALDFALEPSGGSEGSSLGFDPADGDSDQRWTAGT